MIEFDLTLERASGFTLALKAQLAAGGATALFGPSGSGKTTLLRILAGLETPDSGFLRVNGALWFEGRRSLAPQERRVGMVFQDQALFPHLSVRDNIAFGAARHERALVDELLALCGLEALAQRAPRALSGGQKQRVALARALARRPELLLLDEPLSALDAATRQQLQTMLTTLQRRFACSMVLVSHDLAEVFTLADHVLRLENGQLAETGSPAALFLPQSRNRGRYPLCGTVLAVQPADVLWRLSVLIGNDTVDLLINPDQAAVLAPGQRIALSAGALDVLPSSTNYSKKE